MSTNDSRAEGYARRGPWIAGVLLHGGPRSACARCAPDGSARTETPQVSLLALGDTGARTRLDGLREPAARGGPRPRDGRRALAGRRAAAARRSLLRRRPARERADRARARERRRAVLRLRRPLGAALRGGARGVPGRRRATAGRSTRCSAITTSRPRRAAGSPSTRSRPFVANFRLSGEPATWVELAPRVSLVLFDSNQLQNGGDTAPLRDALRAAPGPWRILVAHHPIGTHGRRDEYTKDVRAAVRESGVPVQLMLAGHEHSLQVVAQDDPGPRLVVVSGAGSRPRDDRDQESDPALRLRRARLRPRGSARTRRRGAPPGDALRHGTLARAPRVRARDPRPLERRRRRHRGRRAARDPARGRGMRRAELAVALAAALRLPRRSRRPRLLGARRAAPRRDRRGDARAPPRARSARACRA